MEKGDWQHCSRLPDHAPRNAVYGRVSGWYATLGGVVWNWADKDGRDLGDSNAVPPNIYGETTRPGEHVEPGPQIVDPATIARRGN